MAGVLQCAEHRVDAVIGLGQPRWLGPVMRHEAGQKGIEHRILRGRARGREGALDQLGGAVAYEGDDSGRVERGAPFLAQ
jgi:hypothetical protein